MAKGIDGSSKHLNGINKLKKMSMYRVNTEFENSFVRESAAAKIL